MRVAITGGAGFIGSHLIERFLRENVQVIAIDNLLTGRRQNIEHLLGDERFRIIEQDICKGIDISEKLTGVLHLASPASPPDYLEYPLATLDVGSRGTQASLELARRHNARFLLASTSEIYGDPLVHPQREEYWGNVNPVGPRSVYDEAKRFAEALTMAYYREFNLSAVIVRIFNTYGPRMRPRDGRVVSNFIVQSLLNEPITIYGDGSQTRSFCYVDDLVEGIFLAFNSDLKEPINLGNPHEITVRELAEIIRDLTASESQVRFHPLPPDDPRRRCPDISRAQRRLGWSPGYDLRKGLMKTIAYFSKLLNGVASAERRRSGLLMPVPGDY